MCLSTDGVPPRQRAAPAPAMTFPAFAAPGRCPSWFRRRPRSRRHRLPRRSHRLWLPLRSRRHPVRRRPRLRSPGAGAVASSAVAPERPPAAAPALFQPTTSRPRPSRRAPNRRRRRLPEARSVVGCWRCPCADRPHRCATALAAARAAGVWPRAAGRSPRRACSRPRRPRPREPRVLSLSVPRGREHLFLNESRHRGTVATGIQSPGHSS